MRLDAHKRNTIEAGKKKQLTDAQDEIFADYDQVNKRDQKLSELSKVQAFPQEKPMTEDEARERGKTIMADLDARERKRVDNQKLNLDQDIFGNDDLDE